MFRPSVASPAVPRGYRGASANLVAFIGWGIRDSSSVPPCIRGRSRWPSGHGNGRRRVDMDAAATSHRCSAHPVFVPCCSIGGT